jgi:hypothetical protein
LIKGAYPKEYNEILKEKLNNNQSISKDDNQTDIIIDDNKLANYHFCPECSPKQ